MARIDETHDPKLRSWVESANRPGTPFPIQNLPYASLWLPRTKERGMGVAIGDRTLNVGPILGLDSAARVIAMSASDRATLRRDISKLLRAGARRRRLLGRGDCVLLPPCPITDFTDFYASRDHAMNVGKLFRPNNPLLPNYDWVPVAYHGRASTVVLSGSEIRRPWGQIKPTPDAPPAYAPSRKLDYEVELGVFVGPGNEMGAPIPIAKAEQHVAGVCLLNDWSARDIQSWEYQPLGPFLGKNFATTISPWMVTLDALEPFRCAAPEHECLPYLRQQGDGAFHVEVEAAINGTTVSKAEFAGMYWTVAQMLAHHTSNGCRVSAGSLMGTGTISGPGPRSGGCLLELTRDGAAPLPLKKGQQRTYLQDGDTVTLRAWCKARGFRRIGLGECSGKLLPALAGL